MDHFTLFLRRIAINLYPEPLWLIWAQQSPCFWVNSYPLRAVVRIASRSREAMLHMNTTYPPGSPDSGPWWISPRLPPPPRGAGEEAEGRAGWGGSRVSSHQKETPPISAPNCDLRSGSTAQG